MPTDERIAAGATELTAKYERLGYEVEGFVGPDDRPDAEEFYLYVTGGVNLYVTLDADDAVGSLTYPYSVARAVGNRLTDDEREAVAAVADTATDPAAVGGALAERASPALAHEFRFRLAQAATGPAVNVACDRTDDGFPLRFRAYRSLLPYDDSFGLRTLDDRTETLRAAGDGGSRFVRAALAVETDGEPTDYGLRLRF